MQRIFGAFNGDGIVEQREATSRVGPHTVLRKEVPRLGHLQTVQSWTEASGACPERAREIHNESDAPNAHLDTTANLELSSGLFKREPAADPCATANLNNHGTCADSTRSTNSSDPCDAPEIDTQTTSKRTSRNRTESTPDANLPRALDAPWRTETTNGDRTRPQGWLSRVRQVVPPLVRAITPITQRITGRHRTAMPQPTPPVSQRTPPTPVLRGGGLGLGRVVNPPPQTSN